MLRLVIWLAWRRQPGKLCPPKTSQDVQISYRDIEDLLLHQKITLTFHMLKNSCSSIWVHYQAEEERQYTLDDFKNTFWPPSEGLIGTDFTNTWAKVHLKTEGSLRCRAVWKRGEHYWFPLSPYYLHHLSVTTPMVSLCHLLIQSQNESYISEDHTNTAVGYWNFETSDLGMDPSWKRKKWKWDNFWSHTDPNETLFKGE